MSWKPEWINANGGVFIGNALRFATKEEALACAAHRATSESVRNYRAVEDRLRANYRWNGGLELITQEERERAIYDAKPELLE